ncbi:hypothetical protein H6G89_18605 [Oscillatoria sp. FACHB-1407]|uniref:hypothetical protein n=1 Tax=Oscillatoria sp. FACHB-1407 TaxID=2692847 RepID=UPI0016825CF4|nr:hypothetical protein [Oscillatoria sp. FACHB-1407]MBD2463052.1 hypothetical protein [Oscillatoria sp. FACHB-1407]
MKTLSKIVTERNPQDLSFGGSCAIARGEGFADDSLSCPCASTTCAFTVFCGGGAIALVTVGS